MTEKDSQERQTGINVDDAKYPSKYGSSEDFEKLKHLGIINRSIFFKCVLIYS